MMMMGEDGSIQRERGSYCPTLSTQRARQLIGEACYLAGTRSLWRGFTETERTTEREREREISHPSPIHVYQLSSGIISTDRRSLADWLAGRPGSRLARHRLLDLARSPLGGSTGRPTYITTSVRPARPFVCAIPY